MSADLEIDDALFGRSYVRGLRQIEIRPGEDQESYLQFAPVAPPSDSPVMLHWLERMDELGRQSKAFRERSRA